MDETIEMVADEPQMNSVRLTADNMLEYYTGTNWEPIIQIAKKVSMLEDAIVIYKETRLSELTPADRYDRAIKIIKE